MQGKQLFEYAVIRIVPMVEREEFLNIGVILYCRGLGFLQTKYLVDEQRILSFSPTADLELIREHLCAFEKIALGDANAGEIAKLDIASRFRWLTAARSTIVQSSKVHPGFCHDPQEMLERLFNQMVLIPESGK